VLLGIISICLHLHFINALAAILLLSISGIFNIPINPTNCWRPWGYVLLLVAIPTSSEVPVLGSIFQTVTIYIASRMLDAFAVLHVATLDGLILSQSNRLGRLLPEVSGQPLR